MPTESPDVPISHDSLASAYQHPFRPALGPSGLLDFVLRALRALRPCDPRNDAIEIFKKITLKYKKHREIQKVVVVVVIVLLLFHVVVFVNFFLKIQNFPENPRSPFESMGTLGVCVCTLSDAQ